MLKTAIALFAWNRPSHLDQVLSALSGNQEISELPLFVILDGPRCADDVPNIQRCHDAAISFNHARNTTVIQRRSNLGLFDSLTQGISSILLEYDSIVVLEDDIVVSPFFLSYMMQGLSLYRDSSSVASIHAYTPPFSVSPPESFFLPGADCWGWATWRHQWKLFRYHAESLAFQIRRRKLASKFNLNNNYDYLAMLDDRAATRNNSWAICWHASCFLAGKLTLYPGRSLVSNIGLDGSGQNCTVKAGDLFTKTDHRPLSLTPLEPVVSPALFDEYSRYFSSSSRYRSRLRKSCATIKYWWRALLAYCAKSGLTLIGPYKTYADAKKKSGYGYNTKEILEKVATSTTDLLEGTGVYERDGTLFQELPHNLKITRILEEILPFETGTVVDYGGGLGGLYLNHRRLFNSNHHFLVVEQPMFVQQGHNIATKYSLPIHFATTLSDAPYQPLVIILSAVLQYLPDPIATLESVVSAKPKYIILDRVALRARSQQSWWLQIEKDYYSKYISYPISPLLEEDIFSALRNYQALQSWTNDFDPLYPHHRGYLFLNSQ